VNPPRLLPTTPLGYGDVRLFSRRAPPHQFLVSIAHFQVTGQLEFSPVSTSAEIIFWSYLNPPQPFPLVVIVPLRLLGPGSLPSLSGLVSICVPTEMILFSPYQPVVIDVLDGVYGFAIVLQAAGADNPALLNRTS